MPSVAFRAPSLILCFLVPRVPNRPQCAVSLLFAEMLAPGWVHVFAAKNNIDFLLFCDFVAEIYKTKKEKETNGIKFKRGGFDKID